MSEQLNFQTETQQLLDLMIHSLYSNKEIFLRELISNASDALDKRRFEGVTNPSLLPDDELHIHIETDKEARTLTLIDNGIGMSRQEVIENIGTIARSGTREFLAMAKGQGGTIAPELIGQFGVGFYSSFLVASRVELVTRKAGEDTATRWTSEGKGTYTIDDAQRPNAGTTIILHLLPVDEENGIEDYTDAFVIQRLVRRYSDYVGYPITMQVERREPVLGADGKPLEGALPRIVHEVETLNSRKAIWAKDPAEVTEEEYKEFYKHVSHDWNDPLTHFATRIEGNFQAQALLYVPRKAPYDIYHRDMVRRGVQLYVKRVFIMDEAKDLLPDYLRFMKGVVDAEDLSLNVSREMLQQDRQIKAIRKHLVKKTLDHLSALCRDDRERYVTFWKELGPVLKEGLLEDLERRERLLDLVLTPSSTQGDALTSLAEVADRMPDSQETFYYLTAPTLEVAKRSPHLEAFHAKNIEVLFFTDGVDEVWLQMAPTYRGKRFQSIGKGEVELGTEDEKKEATKAREEREAEHKELLNALRAAIQDDIKEVRLSSRLTSSAACLVTDEGGITPQMERLMKASGQPVPKVKRILELNPEHALFGKLSKVHDADPKSDVLRQYARLLYNQALLAEGGHLEDPAAFAKAVAQVMADAL